QQLKGIGHPQQNIHLRNLVDVQIKLFSFFLVS
ncbi:MAG: hypothetical protein ACI8W1_002188, partial [Candidatus Azotimanducaceae bacterium]